MFFSFIASSRWPAWSYLCCALTQHMCLNPLQSVRVLLLSHTLVYLVYAIIQQRT